MEKIAQENLQMQIIAKDGFNIESWGPNEMTQQLGGLAALPEDTGSIPSINMAAHHHLSFQSPKIQHSSAWLPQA